MMDLRKLDVLISEQVMGLKPQIIEHKHPTLGVFIFDQTRVKPEAWVRHYSTDIAAAWLVVEKMSANFTFHLRHWNAHPPSDSWDAAFSILHDADLESFATDIGDVKLAICLAALKAKGIDVSEWES